MLDAHVSQFYEWLRWTMGGLEQVPKDPAERKKWLGERPMAENIHLRNFFLTGYGGVSPTAALALTASWLFLPSASLGQGKHQGHGNPHANKNFDDQDERWEQRDGYEYRTYSDQDGRPPGWSRGKKTGWGNCGLPPGQAKKYGCRRYVYEGRPHYY